MKKKGFTLSELLLAALILVVALSAILIEFLACSVLNDSSRNLTLATTHAGYIMEDIKNTSFANIANNINNGDWDWDSSDITGEGLTALRNESIDSSVSGTTLLTVTVTVSWKDRNNRDRNVALATLIAEP